MHVEFSFAMLPHAYGSARSQASPLRHNPVPPLRLLIQCRRGQFLEVYARHELRKVRDDGQAESVAADPQLCLCYLPAATLPALGQLGFARIFNLTCDILSASQTMQPAAARPVAAGTGVGSVVPPLCTNSGANISVASLARWSTLVDMLLCSSSALKFCILVIIVLLDLWF